MSNVGLFDKLGSADSSSSVSQRGTAFDVTGKPGSWSDSTSAGSVARQFSSALRGSQGWATATHQVGDKVLLQENQAQRREDFRQKLQENKSLVLFGTKRSPQSGASSAKGGASFSALAGAMAHSAVSRDNENRLESQQLGSDQAENKTDSGLKQHGNSTLEDVLDFDYQSANDFDLGPDTLDFDFEADPLLDLDLSTADADAQDPEATVRSRVGGGSRVSENQSEATSEFSTNELLEAVAETTLEGYSDDQLDVQDQSDGDTGGNNGEDSEAGLSETRPQEGGRSSRPAGRKLPIEHNTQSDKPGAPSTSFNKHTMHGRQRGGSVHGDFSNTNDLKNGDKFSDLSAATDAPSAADMDAMAQTLMQPNTVRQQETPLPKKSDAHAEGGLSEGAGETTERGISSRHTSSMPPNSAAPRRGSSGNPMSQLSSTAAGLTSTPTSTLGKSDAHSDVLGAGKIKTAFLTQDQTQEPRVEQLSDFDSRDADHFQGDDHKVSHGVERDYALDAADADWQDMSESDLSSEDLSSPDVTVRSRIGGGSRVSENQSESTSDPSLGDLLEAVSESALDGHADDQLDVQDQSDEGSGRDGNDHSNRGRASEGDEKSDSKRNVLRHSTDAVIKQHAVTQRASNSVGRAFAGESAPDGNSSEVSTRSKGPLSDEKNNTLSPNVNRSGSQAPSAAFDKMYGKIKPYLFSPSADRIEVKPSHVEGNQTSDSTTGHSNTAGRNTLYSTDGNALSADESHHDVIADSHERDTRSESSISVDHPESLDSGSMVRVRVGGGSRVSENEAESTSEMSASEMLEAVSGAALEGLADDQLDVQGDGSGDHNEHNHSEPESLENDGRTELAARNFRQAESQPISKSFDGMNGKTPHAGEAIQPHLTTTASDQKDVEGFSFEREDLESGRVENNKVSQENLSPQGRSFTKDSTKDSTSFLENTTDSALTQNKTLSTDIESEIRVRVGDEAHGHERQPETPSSQSPDTIVPSKIRSSETARTGTASTTTARAQGGPLLGEVTVGGFAPGSYAQSHLSPAAANEKSAPSSSAFESVDASPVDEKESLSLENKASPDASSEQHLPVSHRMTTRETVEHTPTDSQNLLEMGTENDGGKAQSFDASSLSNTSTPTPSTSTSTSTSTSSVSISPPTTPASILTKGPDLGAVTVGTYGVNGAEDWHSLESDSVSTLASEDGVVLDDMVTDSALVDSMVVDSAVADSTVADSTVADSVPYNPVRTEDYGSGELSSDSDSKDISADTETSPTSNSKSDSGAVSGRSVSAGDRVEVGLKVERALTGAVGSLNDDVAIASDPDKVSLLPSKEKAFSDEISLDQTPNTQELSRELDELLKGETLDNTPEAMSRPTDSLLSDDLEENANNSAEAFKNGLDEGVLNQGAEENALPVSDENGVFAQEHKLNKYTPDEPVFNKLVSNNPVDHSVTIDRATLVTPDAETVSDAVAMGSGALNCLDAKSLIETDRSENSLIVEDAETTEADDLALPEGESDRSSARALFAEDAEGVENRNFIERALTGAVGSLEKSSLEKNSLEKGGKGGLEERSLKESITASPEDTGSSDKPLITQDDLSEGNQESDALLASEPVETMIESDALVTLSDAGESDHTDGDVDSQNQNMVMDTPVSDSDVESTIERNDPLTSRQQPSRQQSTQNQQQWDSLVNGEYVAMEPVTECDASTLSESQFAILSSPSSNMTSVRRYLFNGLPYQVYMLRRQLREAINESLPMRAKMQEEAQELNGELNDERVMESDEIPVSESTVSESTVPEENVPTEVEEIALSQNLNSSENLAFSSSASDLLIEAPLTPQPLRPNVALKVAQHVPVINALQAAANRARLIGESQEEDQRTLETEVSETLVPETQELETQELETQEPSLSVQVPDVSSDMTENTDRALPPELSQLVAADQVESSETHVAQKTEDHGFDTQFYEMAVTEDVITALDDAAHEDETADSAPSHRKNTKETSRRSSPEDLSDNHDPVSELIDATMTTRVSESVDAVPEEKAQDVAANTRVRPQVLIEDELGQVDEEQESTFDTQDRMEPFDLDTQTNPDQRNGSSDNAADNAAERSEVLDAQFDAIVEGEDFAFQINESGTSDALEEVLNPNRKHSQSVDTIAQGVDGMNVNTTLGDVILEAFSMDAVSNKVVFVDGRRVSTELHRLVSHVETFYYQETLGADGSSAQPLNEGVAIRLKEGRFQYLGNAELKLRIVNGVLEVSFTCEQAAGAEFLTQNKDTLLQELIDRFDGNVNLVVNETAIMEQSLTAEMSYGVDTLGEGIEDSSCETDSEDDDGVDEESDSVESEESASLEAYKRVIRKGEHSQARR